MRRVLMLIAVLAVVAAACSGSEPVSSADGVAADGQQAYSVNCADCHAADLRGNARGPSLLEGRFLLPGYDDDELWDAIRKGVVDPEGDYGPMPGFPKLGRQDAADLMAYIRDAQASASSG